MQCSCDFLSHLQVRFCFPYLPFPHRRWREKPAAFPWKIQSINVKRAKHELEFSETLLKPFRSHDLAERKRHKNRCQFTPTSCIILIALQEMIIRLCCMGNLLPFNGIDLICAWNRATSHRLESLFNSNFNTSHTQRDVCMLAGLLFV